MDIPIPDLELNPQKFEEVKEGGPLFHCDLFDLEVVHKIAQLFLPGLATACVDNIAGDLFKSPSSIAVEMRKEMIEYLTQRSEMFIAESVVLEGGPDAEMSDLPMDIISDFIDDFASSKRNLFSRVSGWLLSERREDKIDDLVQEMEINRFWLMDRREAIAEALLKKVDFNVIFHCQKKFNSMEELAEHSSQCTFRSINCTNEGCRATFCAIHMEEHDLVCPFKIIPCEQKCLDSIMRREMDRHCITVCPMRLINCHFFPVGCRFTIPYCLLKQHHLECLDSHLLYILQLIHKEASVQDLSQRVEQLVKSSSANQLSEAQDVRSLTSAVKHLEEKLGPLEVDIVSKVSEGSIQTKNP